ncbi:hypothetical protein [Leptolyngbya sp. FACHB-261]|uniref:hypothetical protein n=1 Tax=Leptolyngbya sp. FACHB-261 TaxID=2692806 RepID=UPI0016822A86|nr:hypothetical protein [Leptolyngbya sp. FACHB-261]
MIRQIRPTAAEHARVQVITSLLAQFLGEQNVTTKISLAQGQLKILLQADPLPDQQAMVRLVQRSLQELPSGEVQMVRVYGRLKGEQRPSWGEQFTPDGVKVSSRLTVVPSSTGTIQELPTTPHSNELRQAHDKPASAERPVADPAPIPPLPPLSSFPFPPSTRLDTAVPKVSTTSSKKNSGRFTNLSGILGLKTRRSPSNQAVVYCTFALWCVLGIALVGGLMLALLRSTANLDKAAAEGTEQSVARPRPQPSPQKDPPGTVTSQKLLSFHDLLNQAGQANVVKRVSAYTCSEGEISDTDVSVFVSDTFGKGTPTQKLEYARMLQQAWLSVEPNPKATLRLCSPLGLELARTDQYGVMYLRN